MSDDGSGISTNTSRILKEETQQHDTRIPLYEGLEAQLGVPVVSYYTSFNANVMVDDNDAQMLEDLLQAMDLTDGLYLMISSPGGMALAAERIINICRSYSGNGHYKVIVPEQAKSAASMICLGAKEIMASPTSELGPVGPQIGGNGLMERYSVRRLTEGYHDLFDRAVSTQGRLEPFLQQLENYDERDINELESHLQLSEEISVRSLKESMMHDEDEEDIRECISTFLEPDETKVHGRPIYIEEMRDCSLNIDERPVNSDLWKMVRELHVRLDNFVSKHASKCVESKNDSYVVGTSQVE